MSLTDMVLNFIGTYCLRDVSSDSYTAVADVYEVFTLFSETTYHEHVSALSFMKTMERLGYEVVPYPVYLEVQTLTGENTWRTPPPFDHHDLTAWHICFKGFVFNRTGRLRTCWLDNGHFVRHNLTDEDRELICEEEDLNCR